MTAKGLGFFQVGKILGKKITLVIVAITGSYVEIVFKQFTGDGR
jgi:hypothetical protein